MAAGGRGLLPLEAVLKWLGIWLTAEIRKMHQKADGTPRLGRHIAAWLAGSSPPQGTCSVCLAQMPSYSAVGGSEQGAGQSLTIYC